MLFNICEHFANWCKTGLHRSSQIETWLHKTSLAAISIGQLLPAAVLTGLGLKVGDFKSGSVRTPPIELKKELVQRGLLAADLGVDPLPIQLLSAVGDPFQPFSVGLLLGARKAGQPVLLGGGSQMLAILALALATVKSSFRDQFVEEISIGTTAWLADEISEISQGKRSLVRLIHTVEDFFDVKLFGLASGLRFDKSSYQVLRDYESGYIKEGVGAGALALLAQLNGASCEKVVRDCEVAVDQL